MSKYVLTEEADQDLADIWEYIAGDDIEAADRWDARLRNAFGMLACNPRIGHSRKDLTKIPVLFWPIGAYLIVYRSLASHIEILAITQGARDIPSFLHQRTEN